MWTIGEMSRITGVKYENVKYYCRPSRKNDKGREVGGAGLLKPAEVRGRTNYYDQAALLRLATIDLMSKCELGVDDMRLLLGGQGGVEGVIDAQVAHLEKKLEEVRREIRTARLLGRALAALREDDEEAFDDVLDECAQSAFIDAMEELGRDASLAGLELADPRDADLAKKMLSLYRKKTTLEDRGASDDEIREATKKIDALFLEQAEQTGAGAGSSFLDGLDELWEAGRPPDCEETLCCVDSAYRAIGSRYVSFDATLFKRFMVSMYSGNLLALFMEVACGEGFTRYVLRALDEYCQAMSSSNAGHEGLG